MDGKSMRWKGFSLKVNTDSRMVNTDSRKRDKSVHVQQESLFTFDRNGCSRWAGIGVQLAREYAQCQIDQGDYYTNNADHFRYCADSFPVHFLYPYRYTMNNDRRNLAM